MIFLFQFLPLLLPMNQTFPCHTGSVPIIINDTSRILDVEIYKITFSIERNDILADTAHKRINQICPM